MSWLLIKTNEDNQEQELIHKQYIVRIRMDLSVSKYHTKHLDGDED